MNDELEGLSYEWRAEMLLPFFCFYVQLLPLIVPPCPLFPRQFCNALARRFWNSSPVATGSSSYGPGTVEEEHTGA